MRAAFVGAGAMAATAARMLSERNCEVVLVDTDKERLSQLSEILDCAMINGDGSKPAVLREVGAKDTDILFCVTGKDETNILASLVGRSLGFPRVVTRIEDPEFEHICIELGLTDVVIPDRREAKSLADIALGTLPEDFASHFKAGARLFSFVARPEQSRRVADIALPKRCLIMALYRNGDLIVPDPDTEVAEGDEVIVFTHEENLKTLQAHWSGTAGETGS